MKEGTVIIYFEKTKQLYCLICKKSKEKEYKETLLDKENSIWNSSDNFRFAAGVAGLSMILNNSKEKGKVDFNMVIHLIQTATTYDPDGTRREFLNLVNKLKRL